MRAKQVGLTLADMEELTVGFITDVFIENGNDNCEYRELATQDDFDNF